jgi:drug/metabolite transporter (DMT)-like permease
MSILFALLGAFSQALTSVLQRLANIAGEDKKKTAWETTRFLIRQPLWLLGMVCMGGTFVFTALALYFGELATVQPILVTELIFTLALLEPGAQPVSCVPA